ncbi:hypothetical protein [Flexivirga endophytica]|nr:hypothetical protein [Flexivirga endophytica]
MTSQQKVSRRTIAKGAAWSVPVVAVAAAAPAASASTGTDIGAVALNGVCGLLGTVNQGFTLAASATAPVPAGSVVTITGSGLASVTAINLSNQIANVTIGTNSATIVLSQDLPAGQTLSMTTLLSISVSFDLNGSLTLPTGYSATGGKLTGSVNVGLPIVGCSAN